MSINYRGTGIEDLEVTDLAVKIIRLGCVAVLVLLKSKSETHSFLIKNSTQIENNFFGAFPLRHMWH